MRHQIISGNIITSTSGRSRHHPAPRRGLAPVHELGTAVLTDSGGSSFQPRQNPQINRTASPNSARISMARRCSSARGGDGNPAVLGSDIAMAFSTKCPPTTLRRAKQKLAVEAQTIRWRGNARTTARAGQLGVFGIVQGGA